MSDEKLKTVNTMISQIVLRNLGMYASSYLGNDLYYLVEAVNILISDVGEKWLEKKHKEAGKDWNKVKEKLETINKLVSQVKVFYDPIVDKKFEKKDKEVGKVQSMFKSYFVRTASKLPLLQRELYDLLILLVNNTTLRNATIPIEAFRILEHKDMRKLDLTKRPVPPPGGTT